MRTALTLDDDVVTEFRAEARRAGRPLVGQRAALPRQNFKISPRDLGNIRPGLSLDNLTELLDQIEGSFHR